MNNEVPMTKSQKEIMKEFYGKDPTRVIFNKNERDELWKRSIERDNRINFEDLKQKCPALVKYSWGI